MIVELPMDRGDALETGPRGPSAMVAAARLIADGPSALAPPRTLSNVWLLLGVGIALALQATAMLWPAFGSVLRRFRRRRFGSALPRWSGQFWSPK